MTTFADPTFTSDYQGLCNKIADVLNRQDLTTSIPDFTKLATARIQRDMVRANHPSAITRLTVSATSDYTALPADFISVYQLLCTDTKQAIIYVSPDQSADVLSQGWDTTNPQQLMLPPFLPPSKVPIYYTIIGNQLRIFPAPSVSAPLSIDLWYYATLPAINTGNATNWVLTRYPDLYLYGSLLHSAPYLKADERLQIWDGLYKSIYADIEVEADQALRSQTKLVAARKSF